MTDEDRADGMEVREAMLNAGIPPDLNFFLFLHNWPVDVFIPEEDIKQYWMSDRILHPDVAVPEMRFLSGLPIKQDYVMLLHPGYYTGTPEEFDVTDNSANGKLIIRERIDPRSHYGLYNNCTVCRGEKYRHLKAVRFLVFMGGEQVPVACEFCIEEYLEGVAKAARAYLGPANSTK